MSDATYAGVVILEVDGQEIEIISIKVETQTGRKPVKTMNRRGAVRGYADGVSEHKLSVTAAIPIKENGEQILIDWDGITKGKVTMYPHNKEEKRTSYLNCFSISTNESYEVENEARIDVELFATDKVFE